MENETRIVPLEDAGLSIRAYNCLKEQLIKNLNELEKYSERELSEFRNLGQSALNEIKETCRINGIVIDGKRIREREAKFNRDKAIKNSCIYKDAELIADTVNLLMESRDYYDRLSMPEAIEVVKIAYIKDLADTLQSLNTVLQDTIDIKVK